MDRAALESFIAGDYFAPCEAGCDIDARGMKPERHTLQFFCFECQDVICRIAKEQHDPGHTLIHVFMYNKAPVTFIQGDSPVPELIDLDRVHRYNYPSYVMLKAPAGSYIVGPESRAFCCLACRRRLVRNEEPDVGDPTGREWCSLACKFGVEV